MSMLLNAASKFAESVRALAISVIKREAIKNATHMAKTRMETMLDVSICAPAICGVQHQTSESAMNIGMRSPDARHAIINV